MYAKGTNGVKVGMDRSYEQVCDELLELVRPGFGGGSNPHLIARIRALVEEAFRLRDDGYIRSKGRRLIGWAEIACSSRKHEKWGGGGAGLKRVEQFTFEDAYRMRHHSGHPLSGD